MSEVYVVACVGNNKQNRKSVTVIVLLLGVTVVVCYVLVSIVYFYSTLVTLSFYSLNYRLQLAFRLVSMATQLVHLPQIPCHYYYTFGAYQAFRRMYASDEISTSVKMAVEDMDAMLCSSLRQLKPGTASFEYRMIHKCDCLCKNQPSSHQNLN